MKKITIAILAIAATLGACSNEDYLGGHVNKDGAGVPLASLTAQMGQTASDRSWSANDKIGVSVSYYDLTAQNRSFLCAEDAKTFSAETGVPIYIKGDCSVVAYWPFIGTDAAEPVFEIDTQDQTSITDYLFAKTDGVNINNGGAVNLTFERVLANLKINITATDDVISKWILSGAYTDGVVNTYDLSIALASQKDITDSGSAITQIDLKLLPQTVNISEQAVTLMLFGQKRTYSFVLNESQALALTAAQTTTYNVDIKDGMTTIELVPSGTVDWQEK